MQKALITGANSGIGLAITKKLIKNNIFVYGIVRNNEKKFEVEDLFDKATFKAIPCDLKHTEKIFNTVQANCKVKDINILINCAGVGYYGLHETLSPEQISEITTVNLEAPMILCNLMLPYLKRNQGIIMNISSVTASQINTHGCAYGATKAGLSSFTKSLFAEVRKHGVRCINLCPDMTDTNLYRNANFGVSDNQQAYLNTNNVADTCLYCIENSAVTDITIQPQKHQIKRK